DHVHVQEPAKQQVVTELLAQQPLAAHRVECHQHHRLEQPLGWNRRTTNRAVHRVEGRGWAALSSSPRAPTTRLCHIISGPHRASSDGPTRRHGPRGLRPLVFINALLVSRVRNSLRSPPSRPSPQFGVVLSAFVSTDVATYPIARTIAALARQGTADES